MSGPPYQGGSPLRVTYPIPEVDRSAPAEVLEREMNGLLNALAVLRGLRLGRGQLPDTHARVERATRELEVAAINAETVWLRRVGGDRL